jgi:hypothetical protein
MVIDQRNAGASVTLGAVNPQYTLDRWAFQTAQASKLSTQRNAGAVTLPVGFNNYLGITSLSAYSSLATDYFMVRQNIEGYNTSDLMFGTANAQTVTLSFWAYSSLTGTFGGSLLNNAGNRSYPYTYSIPVANTWTKINVSIAGDITGTWVEASNTTGITVYFDLGCGSNNRGTAGAWAGSAFYGATGTVSLVGTSGATFYITGVQLEKGSTATSFDYRPYGTELSLCQRYYEVGLNFVQAYGNNTYGVFSASPFKVTKRTTPTVTNQGLSYAGQTTLGDVTFNAANPSYSDLLSTSQAAIIAANAGGAPTTGMVRYQGYFTASAEL